MTGASGMASASGVGGIASPAAIGGNGGVGGSTAGRPGGGTAGGPSAGAAAPATLGATPPMGWNSWNTFQCDISEALIKHRSARVGRSAGPRTVPHDTETIAALLEREFDTFATD